MGDGEGGEGLKGSAPTEELEQLPEHSLVEATLVEMVERKMSLTTFGYPTDISGYCRFE